MTTYLYVYRPEARLNPDASHDEAPFDGIELHAIGEDESEVKDAIDHARQEGHTTWKWHIDTSE